MRAAARALAAPRRTKWEGAAALTCATRAFFRPRARPRARCCQGAPYHAAKHLESAAKSAKDAGGDGAAARVQDLAAQAATLYCEAGRATTAAEALGRHASAADALGDTDGAVGMLRRAFEFFEEEEAEHYAADTYRAAVNMVLRRKRWADACEFLLKWGASSGRSKAVTTQCRCYLSALVVQLHAGDYDEAERCFNDCCAVPAFSRSDACEAGDRLLMAYRSADSEQIKDAVKVCALHARAQPLRKATHTHADARRPSAHCLPRGMQLSSISRAQCSGWQRGYRGQGSTSKRWWGPR